MVQILETRLHRIDSSYGFDALEKAHEMIFSTALSDGATELARANLRYGLAKIHWLQDQIGVPSDAAFVSAPDFTVTRNSTRWTSGFGYGGSLRWGSGSEDLMILDLKPNACGMYVGGIKETSDPQKLLKSLLELVEDQTELDGIPIEWDVGNSNHFVDVFELEVPQESDLPPYIFMMHIAGGELRAETKRGPGLYWDRSDTLKNQLQLLQTPYCELTILTGREASDYYDFYGYVEAFVRKRRAYAAERIFPGLIFINNDPHQGLVSKNEILLGCYRFSDTEILFPIGLRANSAGYLVRGVANLGDKTMQRLGFEARSETLDLDRWIRNVNLLPHGGGYQYPHIRKVTKVHHIKGKRFFELEFHNSESRQIISEVRNLPFQYRGEEVVRRSVDLQLLDIAARLKPYLVLKV